MNKFIIITLLGILSLGTSFASQKQSSTEDSKVEDEISLEKIDDSISSGSELMLIPLKEKSDTCLKSKPLPSLTQKIIKESKTSLDVEEFMEMTRKDLERFSPDFIVIKFKGKEQINQSKKELPLASRELINILAQEIQKKLEDPNIKDTVKKQLISDLQKDLEGLKKTGEFDAQSYPTLWQILGESLIRNVFFFSTESLVHYVPVISNFSLLSFNIDLKLTLANSLNFGGPLYNLGTKEASSMTLTSACKLVPSISKHLTPSHTPYEKIRSDVVAEHMPSGEISPHGSTYNFIDKKVLPSVLPVVCGSLTYVAASLMCQANNTLLDEPMILVGAFLTQTAIETTVKYVTQKGGTIGTLNSIKKNTPIVAAKAINLTVGGFKIVKSGVDFLTSSLWSGSKALFNRLSHDDPMGEYVY